jgi:hypothetical protein
LLTSVDKGRWNLGTGESWRGEYAQESRGSIESIMLWSPLAGAPVGVQLGRLGRPRKARSGFEKADISTFLGEGERIAGAYLIVRTGRPASGAFTPSFDYFLFINITGLRGYYAYLEGNRSGKPRAFRSFDRILKMLRELGYFGPITIYDGDATHRPPVARGATRRRPGDKGQIAAVQAQG